MDIPFEGAVGLGGSDIEIKRIKRGSSNAILEFN
jgi:hypothetical protein